ncbi:hypothetical protein [Longispora fulva]|uniref:Uncharacterized protein n=1 Tax=Longispora fulva TaxID=619741 RepID=A0A8J7GNW2_9ACTN|nr:hypothetical protein [Longispora fulva]MBG6140498.1 hypothetical protein [Longispora fulva]
MRTPDLATAAERARRWPGQWVRLPADQVWPGLLAAIVHDQIPALPAAEFMTRQTAGVSLLGPRLDLWVRYQPGGPR